MKDSLLIGVVCVAAIAVGAWLFVAGDERLLSPGTPEGPVTFTILAEGNYSGSITERTNYRIKNDAELSELWRMIYGTDGPALPAVDFEKQEILAVFDGTHSSGGYGVRIASIEDTALSRRIMIVRVIPDDACITTSALSSPFVLVAAPKTTLSLSREEITETEVCE